MQIIWHALGFLRHQVTLSKLSIVSARILGWETQEKTEKIWDLQLCSELVIALHMAWRGCHAQDTVSSCRMRQALCEALRKQLQVPDGEWQKRWDFADFGIQYVSMYFDVVRVWVFFMFGLLFSSTPWNFMGLLGPAFASSVCIWPFCALLVRTFAVIPFLLNRMIWACALDVPMYLRYLSVPSTSQVSECGTSTSQKEQWTDGFRENSFLSSCTYVIQALFHLSLFPISLVLVRHVEIRATMKCLPSWCLQKARAGQRLAPWSQICLDRRFRFAHKTRRVTWTSDKIGGWAE